MLAMSNPTKDDIPYFEDEPEKIQETIPNRLALQEIATARDLLWERQNPDIRALYILHVRIAEKSTQLVTLSSTQKSKLETHYPGRAFTQYGFATIQILTALQSLPPGLQAESLQEFLSLQKAEVDDLPELLSKLEKINIISRVQSEDGRDRFVLVQVR